MSKASKYAEQMSMKLVFSLPGSTTYGVGSVNISGNLANQASTLKPADALAYAAWIIDTFGEVPPLAPTCCHGDK